ncbi:MAG: serine/threonine protein kinase [Burkholderiales bacterium]|nr:serine/threonine protein kinase [Burkholderiales bacterium]
MTDHTPPGAPTLDAAPADETPLPGVDTAPYASLTPDRILDALDAVGIHGDGRLLALNSYENRVYLVYCDRAPDAATSVVVKFYRPQRWSDAQIEEEHAFVRELVAHEVPAVAAMDLGGRTLHHDGDLRFAVFPRDGGRTPEIDQPTTLAWIGRYLGRIHAVGAQRRFVHRPTLDVGSFGDASRAFLLDRGVVPDDLRESYAAVSALALTGIRRCYERAGPIATLRLHGDCHAANILWTADGPHFVDFDDARTGPAVQDLWMLLSGDRASMTRQLGDVLSGYEQFADLDRRELHLVEALRSLRLLHYAAWIARRWHDPAFPAAFPWFATHRYWQDRILELREQVAAMDEAPLVV